MIKDLIEHGKHNTVHFYQRARFNTLRRILGIINFHVYAISPIFIVTSPIIKMCAILVFVALIYCPITGSIFVRAQIFVGLCDRRACLIATLILGNRRLIVISHIKSLKTTKSKYIPNDYH